jgi:hypothetical protein
MTLPGETPHLVWVYISGFNIAILVGVFMAVSRPVLEQRRSVLLTISSVVVYTL